MKKGRATDPLEKDRIIGEMKKLEGEGVNRASIAKRFDCSNATVTRYLGAVHTWNKHGPKPEPEVPETTEQFHSAE